MEELEVESSDTFLEKKRIKIEFGDQIDLQNFSFKLDESN